MTRAYVGLGSNIEPEKNVRRAVHLLAERCRLVALSTFLRTEAIPKTQPPYVNGVVAVDTPLAPRELELGVLRDIEARLGRVRTSDKYAPRTIDLDLLIFGGLPAARDVLERIFVAAPLLEIAPDLVLPGTETRLAEVVARLPPHPMTPLEDFTHALRRELEKTRRDGPRTHRKSRIATPS